MKLNQILSIALLAAGCSGAKTESVTTSQGTFILMRPEGPKQANGSFDAAIWRKEGESTNARIYFRTMGGMFTGATP